MRIAHAVLPPEYDDSFKLFELANNMNLEYNEEDLHRADADVELTQKLFEEIKDISPGELQQRTEDYGRFRSQPYR